MICSCTSPFRHPAKRVYGQLTCSEINTISHSSSQSCAIDDMVTTVVIKVVIRPICNKYESIYIPGPIIITEVLQIGKWREKTFAYNKRPKTTSLRTYKERGWASVLSQHDLPFPPLKIQHWAK